MVEDNTWNESGSTELHTKADVNSHCNTHTHTHIQYPKSKEGSRSHWEFKML